MTITRTWRRNGRCELVVGRLGLFLGLLVMSAWKLCGSVPLQGGLTPPQIVIVQPQVPVSGQPVRVVLYHPLVAAHLGQLQWRWADSSHWQPLDGCEWRVAEAPPHRLQVQFRVVDTYGHGSSVTDLILPTVSPRPQVRIVGTEPESGPVYGHPFRIRLVAQSPLLRSVRAVEWRYPGETIWKPVPGSTSKSLWIWQVEKVGTLRLAIEFRGVDEAGLMSAPIVGRWEVSPLVQSFAVGQLGGLRERPALHALALVPKTTRVVFAGDDGLLGWLDWRTAEIRLLPGHSPDHPVWDAAAVTLADNRMLALSGSSDGTARLWDLQKMAQLHVFHGHSGSVNAVAFSPDGQFAFTADESGQCVMRETLSGKLVRNFTIGDAGEPVCALRTWQQGDHIILAAGGADKQLHMWDATEGKKLVSAVADVEAVWALAYAANHYLLTGGKSPELRQWHWLTEKGSLAYLSALLPPEPPLLRPWYGDMTYAAAEFTHDGKFAVSCDRAGRLILWDIVSHCPLRIMQQPNENLHGARWGFSDLAVTPDGEFVLTADRDGYVRLWYIGERTVR